MQIRATWHRQKELDQGRSDPDKPEGHTSKLNSAHPIQLLRPENKAHRGIKYTGELLPEWTQGIPPPRLSKRPQPGKTPVAPILLPDGAGAEDESLDNPTEATVNLLDLNHPAITYSKDATAAIQELPMAQGTEWVPHLLTFQEQGLQSDNPPELTPIYTPDEKAYKRYWHKGTPLYA